MQWNFPTPSVKPKEHYDKGRVRGVALTMRGDVRGVALRGVAFTNERCGIKGCGIYNEGVALRGVALKVWH